MRSVLADGFFTKGKIMQKKDVWGFLVILGLLVSVSSAGLIGQGAMKQKSHLMPRLAAYSKARCGT